MSNLKTKIFYGMCVTVSNKVGANTLTQLKQMHTGSDLYI